LRDFSLALTGEDEQFNAAAEVVVAARFPNRF
jgi:hypothetical protein